MCWNVAVAITPKEMKEQFDFFERVRIEPGTFEGFPNHNTVRLQLVPIVAQRENELRMFRAQWWLVPHWSNDGKPGVAAFNATAERIDSSRLFAPYFKGSRCLFPVSSFYEFKQDELVTVESGGKKKKLKQAYCISLKSGAPMLMAGVFSVWRDKTTGEERPSFAVITTEANALMSPIHTRMPVLLDASHADMWLDRSYKEVSPLKKLLVPFAPAKMKAWKVDAAYLSDKTRTDKRCCDPMSGE